MTQPAARPAPARTLTVEVWSDIACLWCFIGKHRLDAAIAQARTDLPDLEIEVRYRAFLLDPHAAPADGRTEVDMLALKFGDRERAVQMLAELTALGAQEGLAFDTDAIVPTTTRPAHALLAYAARVDPAAQPRVADALFRAHFEQGRDVGDASVLGEIAAAAGLDEASAVAALTDPVDAAAVADDLAQARELGITGVPFYVFDGKYSAAGAQSSDFYRGAFAQIAGS